MPMHQLLPTHDRDSLPEQLHTCQQLFLLLYGLLRLFQIMMGSLACGCMPQRDDLTSPRQYILMGAHAC